MVSGLGYLGAGLGGIQQGFNQEWDQAVQQGGQIALGRTLQLLGAGQQPMQPPLGPPMGGPPPQFSPQMAGGPQPQGSPPMGGQPPPMQPPPQPQQPMGGPPIGPQPGMGGPPPMGGGGTFQQPQPPPQQQPSPQMQPQGWGPQAGMGGGFDIRQIVQAIVAANPGAPPQIIGAATENFIKTVLPPQLREQALQNALMLGVLRADVATRGQDVRAETAQRGQDVTARGQDIRAETAEKARISRETIAAAGLQGRQAMFEAGLISKEEMDAANREERGREADQRAAVATKGIETRAETAATAESGRETRSVRQAETVQRGQDIRAETVAQAEAGRTKRAELSDATKREMTKLSVKARRDIAAAAEAGKDYRTSYQEGARTQRAQLSADTRKEIAQLSEQARRELTEYTEGGRMERAEQARTSREDIAAAGREQKGQQFGQKLDLQKSQLQTRIEAINTQRQIYGLPKVGEAEAAQIGSHSPAVTGADRIADQIVSGKRPPSTTGLGMHGGFQVSQSLATRYPEFDQTQATLEFDAAKRTIIGMTSPQQVRFQQLGRAVVNTFDKVIEDARKMKLSGITPLNKADIDYLVNTRGNTPAGKLAAVYLQDVAFLKGEVANLENGGYAPTESSWEQAKQVINENYGVDEMIATAHNAQRLINFRLHALTELPGGRLGVGAGANPYLQPGAPSPHEQRQQTHDLGGGWTVQEHQ